LALQRVLAAPEEPKGDGPMVAVPISGEREGTMRTLVASSKARPRLNELDCGRYSVGSKDIESLRTTIIVGSIGQQLESEVLVNVSNHSKGNGRVTM
jgi:hypothetical protein